MGGSRDALQRYALAVVSHLLLVAVWYFFVELSKVPSFVMPSPQATLNALLVPNYRWLENIAVTATEIFGGYILAVVVGVGLALIFSWFRWLELALMPLLVSLNMIPKVALGPLIIVWFKYGIGPNIMMAFASIDPLRGQAAIDEARRLIKDGRIRGFKLHPPLQQFVPTRERYLVRASARDTRVRGDAGDG